MTVGQILDRTINLYRRNFLLFFGIAMLPAALYLLAQLALRAVGLLTESGEIADEAATGLGFDFTTTVAVMVIAVIVYLLGYSLSMAATIHAVSAVHLGRSMGIQEAYGRLRGRVGRIINVMLSVIVRVFGGWMLLFLLGIGVTAVAVPFLSGMLGTVGTVLGTIIGIAAIAAAVVLGLLLFLRYSIAVQACVLENIKAREALRRSVALTKGGRGRILVIWVVVAVLTYVVMIPLYIPVFILAATYPSAWFTESVNYLMEFFVGTLVGPVGAIALSLVYYDERVRKEALDIELMMSALDQPANPNAPGPGYTG